MKVTVKCPACKESFNVEPDAFDMFFGGSHVDCPECGYGIELSVVQDSPLLPSEKE